MTAPIFIGDEVTAAGYRLAGARVRVPEAGGVGRELNAALGEAELVLITAAAARELPEDDLVAAVRAAAPLVLVVPDVAGLAPPPDLSLAVDRVLGIES